MKLFSERLLKVNDFSSSAILGFYILGRRTSKQTKKADYSAKKYSNLIILLNYKL